VVDQSNEFSGTTGRIFSKVSVLVELCKGLIKRFFTDESSLSRCYSVTDWNIGTPVGSLEAHLMWLHRVHIW